MSDETRLSAEEIEELPQRSRVARDRALEALSLMRTRGLSLTAAVEETGTSRRTMLKYAGRALEKDESGEWEPKPWDRIIRRMKFLKPSGVITLPVRDSRSAEKISRYWRAVQTYLDTGNPDPLRPFQGEHVQVKGLKHPFVTDLETIERNQLGGTIRFENIYADTD